MMALGNFSFYGTSQLDMSRHGRRIDYYLGSVTGDDFADQAFAERLARVQSRLRRCLGIGNYAMFWSPAVIKIPKTRSPEQRFATSVKKATNKSNRRKAEIIASNLLFAAEFILQEEAVLQNRIGKLRQRYGVQ